MYYGISIIVVKNMCDCDCDKEEFEAFLMQSILRFVKGTTTGGSNNDEATPVLAVQVLN